jgi:hypothetical protein
METKLTLRMEDKLIRRAKAHARKSGRSLSQLVADFFGILESSMESKSFEMTPKVKSLYGSFAGADKHVDARKRHLEDKYL